MAKSQKRNIVPAEIAWEIRQAKSDKFWEQIGPLPTRDKQTECLPKIIEK